MPTKYNTREFSREIKNKPRSRIKNIRENFKMNKKRLTVNIHEMHILNGSFVQTHFSLFCRHSIFFPLKKFFPDVYFT